MVPHNRIQGFWVRSIEPEPPVSPGALSFRGALLLAQQSPPSPEEKRLHAMLHDRIFALQRERPGLWSRLRRFFWGD
jgi:hypothetical protein